MNLDLSQQPGSTHLSGRSKLSAKIKDDALQAHYGNIGNMYLDKNLYKTSNVSISPKTEKKNLTIQML